MGELKERQTTGQATEVLDDDQLFSKRNVKNYVGEAFCGVGTQTTFLSTYFMPFFTNFLGMGAGLVSLLLAIGTAIDGVSDFIAGIVIDRFHTKRGKAVHWIRWMFLPTAISMALIFLCPQDAPTWVKVIYILIIYNVFNTCLTFCRMPSSAMMSLGTDNQSVRTAFWWAAELFCDGRRHAGWYPADLVCQLVRRTGSDGAGRLPGHQLHVCPCDRSVHWYRGLPV